MKAKRWGLRVFATPPEARGSHVRGSARLIRLAMARDFKALRARPWQSMCRASWCTAAWPRIRCCIRSSSPGRDLRDDLLDRIVMTVFLEGREPLRSGAAFDERLALRAGIGLPAQEIARSVQSALERLGRIQAALPKAPAPPRRTSVRNWHGWCRAGFLLHTPAERLREFPR